MTPAENKIALGTAQFGYDYGVSNRSGRTPLPEVRKILERASNAGVTLLDTAYHYRESEATIGSSDPLQKRFSIVTKTPSFKDLSLTESAEPLQTAFKESLTKLRVESVYGLLFHSAKILSDENRTVPIKAAKELKESGQVRKIGVSIYTPEEAFACAKSGWVELVQAPFSILDQRLASSGALAAMTEAGIEVHVRSVFLQGLILMTDSELPAYFNPIREHLAKLRSELNSSNVSPIEATIGFLAGFPQIQKWVIGVNNSEQLKEILACTNEPLDLPFRGYSVSDEKFINPGNWKLN